MPESIRLYVLAHHLNFNHLPVAGGLYDQHPKLIDQWTDIARLVNSEQEREQAAQKRKKK